MAQQFNKINLTCSEFINAIRFILNNNFFQFNNTYYKLIFGSVMGNAISPILVDIVMQDLENEALSKLAEKPFQ